MLWHRYAQRTDTVEFWSPRDRAFVVCRPLRLDDDSEAAPLQWRGTSRGEARRLVHRPAMRMEGANSRADARSVPRHAGVAVAVIVVAALLLSANFASFERQ